MQLEDYFDFLARMTFGLRVQGLRESTIVSKLQCYGPIFLLQTLHDKLRSSLVLLETRTASLNCTF